MDKRADLQPCPFCGATTTEKPENDGVGIYASSGDQWPVEYRIWCEPCGAEMSGSDRDRLIEAWNTRASLAGVEELVGALEGLVRYAESVRVMVGMGKTQQARFDAAKAALAKHREGQSGEGR